MWALLWALAGAAEPGSVSVSLGWPDPVHRGRQVVEFAVSRQELTDARSMPGVAPLEALVAVGVEAMEAHVAQEGWRGVQLTQEGQRLRLHVTGEQAESREAALVAVYDRARDRWLAAHGYQRLADGRVAPDHAGLAVRHGPALHGLVHRLGAARRTSRDFAETSLALVQSLRPERRRRLHGFRLPVAALMDRRGDCDTKAVLFAALLRQAHPALGVAVVLMVPSSSQPGHAVVAVDLPPMQGQHGLTLDGRDWVLAEVVGPDLLRLGQLAPSTVALLGEGPQISRVATSAPPAAGL